MLLARVIATSVAQRARDVRLATCSVTPCGCYLGLRVQPRRRHLARTVALHVRGWFRAESSVSAYSIPARGNDTRFWQTLLQTLRQSRMIVRTGAQGALRGASLGYCVASKNARNRCAYSGCL
jgi:hypothetical protein